MSKVILVIDKPECCLDCPCSYTYGYRVGDPTNDICEVTEHRLTKENMKERIPTWCPLKPLGQEPDEYGLEVWNGRGKTILCEKGLFNKIYED